jgi:hypothetical protein
LSTEWELLFYLDAWLRAGGAPHFRRVSTTNYPYYFVKRKDKKTKKLEYPLTKAKTFDTALNPRPKNDDDAACVAFTDKLSEYYAVINIDYQKRNLVLLKSPFEDYRESDEAKDQRKSNGEKRGQWIRRNVDEKFAHIVDYSMGIDGKSSASAGGTYSGANNRSTKTGWGVKFIRVRSVNDDKHDGERILVARGNPEIELGTTPKNRIINLTIGKAIKRSKTSSNVDPKKARYVISSVVSDLDKPGTSGTSNPGTSGSSKQKIENNPTWSASNYEEFPFRRAAADDKSGSDGDNKSTTDSTHIIYSHDSGDASALADKTPLNEFVRALHNGEVVLSDKPNATSTVTVDNSDEWLSWLTACFGTTTATKVGGDSKNNMTSLTLSFDNPITSTDVTLKFSTAQDELATAFSVDSSVISSQVTDPGLVDEANMMVLALTNTSKALEITVSDLLKKAGFDKLTGLDFTTKTKLKLDSAERSGQRNGVWIFPWLRYQTDLRLAFKIVAYTEIDTVLSYIDSTIKVTSGSAVYRESNSYRETSDGPCIITDYHIAFVLKLSVKIDSNDLKLEAVVEFHDSHIDFILQSVGGITLKTLLAWLQKITSVEDNKLQNWLDKDEFKDKTLSIRRVSFLLNLSNSTPSLERFSIDLEVVLPFGQSKDKAVFLFTYSRSIAMGEKFGTLVGSLWYRM